MVAADEASPSWRILLLGFLLALLVHILFLLMKFDWSGAAAPPRVELQTIDPAKIDAIKKKWQAQDAKAKQLLLNRDKSQPSAAEAPKDARYFSDRNIKVEKEQRAKQTVTVPKIGAPVAGTTEESHPAEKASQAKATPKTPPHARIPNLGDLGVPMNFSQMSKPRDFSKEATQAGNQSAGTRGSTQIGGEQYVKDPNTPEGSENLLNAQESVFYSFYARLYEAIAPVWQSRIREVPFQRRVRPGEYTTVVDAVFAADGKLLAVRRLQASGVEEFDRAVDEAWNKIGRFPNPPKELLDAKGEVHTGWTFTVQVGAGFNLDSLPPERNY